jgi:hypothetical protein
MVVWSGWFTNHLHNQNEHRDQTPRRDFPGFADAGRSSYTESRQGERNQQSGRAGFDSFMHPNLAFVRRDSDAGGSAGLPLMIFPKIPKNVVLVGSISQGLVVEESPS